MAGIDKAAIGWSIAIVAVGVAIAFAGQSGQDLTVAVQTPTAPSTTPSSAPTSSGSTDPFADIAAKVKENPNDTTKMAEKATEPKMAEKATAPKPSGPQTVSVSIPAGSSSPGCEETNACFIPDSVTINAGDTVSWTNEDTAAHTVTAGSPVDGPSGVFDSSLVLGGASYEHTFDDAGSYDYFCMVHPWMVGNVQVN